MKFAAFGRTHWLLDSIRALSSAGHTLVLLGTAKGALDYRADTEDFQALARELDAGFFCDPSINNPTHIKMAADSGADVAISINWPGIVKNAMLSQFRHGVINAHTGDLPRYRGNAPVNWAILNGEKEVVLTLHLMDEGLDTGPVLLKSKYPLTDGTYIADVFEFMTNAIPGMYLEVLNGLDGGTLQPVPQPLDPSLSLRCFPRRPADALLNWSADAIDIVRLVRATSEPFPGAYTYLDGKGLTIWRARVHQLPYPYLGYPGQVAELHRSTGEAIVLAGHGCVALQEVQLENSPRMRAPDLLKSVRIRLGI